jgi:fructoselysine 6-kinase
MILANDTRLISLTKPLTMSILLFSTIQEHTGEAVAREMYKRGPRLVVVTMGSEGALVFDGQKILFHTALKVKVVDTLGAGDTFIATFLAHWVMKKDLPSCMELATQAAARTCTIFGAWEGSRLP